MATAYVKGCRAIKRPAGDAQALRGPLVQRRARNHAPVHLGFSELNDTFLLPFEMAVKLAGTPVR
jgi:beta-glucosidase